MDITIKIDPLTVHNAVAGITQLNSEIIGGMARRLAEAGQLAERLAAQNEELRIRSMEERRQLDARVTQLVDELRVAREELTVTRGQLDALRGTPDSGSPEGTPDESYEPSPPSGMPGDGF